MLGLARRAGKLSMGRDAAVKAICSGRAKALLLAGDISQRAQRDMLFTAGKYSPSMPAIKTEILIDEFYAACGYRAGIITVDDENFGKKIISLTGE